MDFLFYTSLTALLSISSWGCRQKISGSGLDGIYDKKGDSLNVSQNNFDEVDWQLLDGKDPRNFEYNGVVSFHGCSGFLISDNKTEQSPVYLVTNAHCVDGLEKKESPFESKLNPRIDAKAYSFPAALTEIIPYDRNDFDANVDIKYQSAYANYFYNSERTSFGTEKLLYASMTRTDLAILEIKPTLYKREDKINTYMLCDFPAKVGMSIEVVGIPRGDPDSKTKEFISLPEGKKFLRRSICEVESITPLLRESVYDFERALRHKCSVLQGSSGSPVFARDSQGKLCAIGIFNTSADPGEECDLGTPCEMADDQSAIVYPHRNYSQILEPLKKCFVGSEFSLQPNDCTLYRGVKGTELPSIPKQPGQILDAHFLKTLRELNQ